MKKIFTCVLISLFYWVIVKGAHAQASKSDSDTVATPDEFTFINAYNFDFNGQLQSNYLGHLNILKVYKLKNGRYIGFNTGIMKISYNGNNEDSTSNNPSNYHIDNVLIHPLDSANIGDKYLRQQNKYALVKQNIVWSFYVEPLYQLNEGDNNQIFAHLHVELLVNDWTGTTKITTVQQDTAIVNANTTKPRQNIGNSIIYKQTFTNGYFGGGLTFKMKVEDGSSLFFQGTIGVTTSTPSPYSTDINSYLLNTSTNSTMYGFYLVRANYQQKITSKLNIILGTDIRGLFPKYPPMYAVYIGAKLDISALSALLGK